WGSMGTAYEAFGITLAAHDVRTRPHAAGDDAHVSLTSAHCALAGDEHVLAVVVLPGHVVVMATHDRDIRFEPRSFSRRLHRRNHVLHHQFTISQCVVLCPVHCADVV